VRQEARLERFVRGWNPHNLPPTYLNPRELGEGQVLDARGVRFTPGGSLFWDRNQLRIASPASVSVKSVVDFYTDDYNQLLAFCKDDATARMYRLTTDWPNVGAPTQWTYGYEVFAAQNWAEVTSEAAALAHLQTFGIAAAAQSREALLICPQAGKAVLAWDGATVRVVGLSAPSLVPTNGGTAAGVLRAGSYSYYYSFFDPDSGFESMPSPVLDVHVTTADKKITVQGLSDFGKGYYKRLYRAYSEDSGADARGADFYLVTILGPGASEGLPEDLSTWTEVDTVDDRLLVGETGNQRVTATALQENEAAYIYSDETEIKPDEIDFRFAVNVTSLANDGEVIVFGVSDTVGVGSAWTHGKKVEVWRDGSQYFIGDKTADNGVGISAGTSYYCRLIYQVYTGSSGLPRYAKVYLSVHEAADYSDPPTIVHIASGDVLSLRYAYGICAAGGAGTEAFSGYVESIILGGNTVFTDNTPEYALGEALAFDRARPPRGSILAWHKERAFMAGSNEGSRSYPGYAAGEWGNVLFFSELDEPYYWPGDNIIVVGDDAPITGLVSWGDYLVVFKQNGVWTVTGWGTDDFRVTQQAGLPGCVGNGAYCAAPPGVAWLAADGYYFWNGAELRQLVEISDETPWAVVKVTPKVPTITYHDDRFYMQQEDGWIEWAPAADQFAYHEATFADGDAHRAGLWAVQRGTNQTHVLTRMLWATGGSQEITVLDPSYKFANHAGEGTSYSDLFAPVQITLPPLDAPPGYLIQPLELWVSGTWVDHAEATKHVKAHLNADASYSAVAGANAWATTPDAPQEGEVLGVPLSYEYGAASTCTNAARRWYIQLKAEYAKDFRLEAVTVRYLLRRASGA